MVLYRRKSQKQKVIRGSSTQIPLIRTILQMQILTVRLKIVQFLLVVTTDRDKRERERERERDDDDDDDSECHRARQLSLPDND